MTAFERVPAPARAADQDTGQALSRTGPVRRRASNTGVIMVAGQKIALGRIYKHQTVTVLVSQSTPGRRTRRRRRAGYPPHHHPAGA